MGARLDGGSNQTVARAQSLQVTPTEPPVPDASTSTLGVGGSEHSHARVEVGFRAGTSALHGGAGAAGEMQRQRPS